MEKPIEPWEDAVDIADTLVGDFDGRNTSINTWDEKSVYRNALDQFATQIDTSRSIVGDFAVRIYIAYLYDHDEQITDRRDEYEQKRLIPPRGWFDDYRDELPLIDPTIEVKHISNDRKKQCTFQTAPIVHDIIGDIIDSDNRWDNYSEFIKSALSFTFNQYESEEPLFHERMQTET